jgi:hypothetical protein
VELNILGTWHQLYTKETAQVSSYIMEAHKLMKTKVARARLSHIPSPTGPTSVQPFDSTLEPPRMLTPEVVVLYRDKRDEAESTADESKAYEWPANETQDEKTVAAVVASAEVSQLYSWTATLNASLMHCQANYTLSLYFRNSSTITATILDFRNSSTIIATIT